MGDMKRIAPGCSNCKGDVSGPAACGNKHRDRSARNAWEKLPNPQTRVRVVKKSARMKIHSVAGVVTVQRSHRSYNRGLDVREEGEGAVDVYRVIRSLRPSACCQQ